MPRLRDKCKDPAGILEWIDCHPRTGWYIAIIATLNAILEVVSLLRG